MVTYVGGAGKEHLGAALQLADRTLLIGGGADSLDWLSPTVPRIALSAAGINSAAAGQTAFVLHLSADLQTILQALVFPSGTVQDVRFIKSAARPGAAGDLVLSGTRSGGSASGDGKDQGYFIAKLNANFVDAVPSGLAWAWNVWATDDHAALQPWDVGGDGKVVYATGEPFGTNWAAVYRLKADGSALDVVENWRYHWTAGGEVYGAPAATIPGVLYSGLVFKSTNRGSLRSDTLADYQLLQPDGNGATKQGTWPLDYFYSGPFDPANPSASGGGPGYTSYRLGSAATQRIGGLAVDRRTNHI